MRASRARLISEQPARQAFAASNRPTLYFNPSKGYNFSSLHLWVARLLENGELSLKLENGAKGKLLYIPGHDNAGYLGFALKDVEGEGYTVYARVVFASQSEGGVRYLQGGYGIKDFQESGALKENVSLYPELAEDHSTPVYVSEGIREGYGGVGAFLMLMAMQLGIREKADAFRILVSFADGFYENLGFRPNSTGRLILDLRRFSNTEQARKVRSIEPKGPALSSAFWRPQGKTEEESLYETIGASDSFGMRLKRALTGLQQFLTREVSLVE